MLLIIYMTIITINTMMIKPDLFHYNIKEEAVLSPEKQKTFEYLVYCPQYIYRNLYIYYPQKEIFVDTDYIRNDSFIYKKEKSNNI